MHFTALAWLLHQRKVLEPREVVRAPKVATYTRTSRASEAKSPDPGGRRLERGQPRLAAASRSTPSLTTKYFLGARTDCKGCKIVAADVLDSSNMERWLRGIDAKDKGKARIYGLHNYSDVNRKRSSGTTPLLRTVGGEVWLTETGGILKFLPQFKRSEKRQASSTKYMFRLASRYDTRRSGMRSRISRLYKYQSTGAAKSARFDAGLVGPTGKPRKAFKVFKKLEAKHD